MLNMQFQVLIQEAALGIVESSPQRGWDKCKSPMVCWSITSAAYQHHFCTVCIQMRLSPSMILFWPPLN